MSWILRRLLLLCCVCLSALAKEQWLPISAEEKARTQSSLIAEAPAEILFRRINIDERYMPERTVKEYIRYKIYAIDKALPYTRLSKLVTESGDSKATVKLSARLVLPDGTTKLFGKEAIQERIVNESAAEKTLLRRLLGSSSPVTKEKFLAISGIETGCILEYQIEVQTTGFRSFMPYLLQSPELPTLQAELICHYYDSEKVIYRCFPINHQIGKAQLDFSRAKGYAKITATDLPPLPREPLSGSPGDYALTLLSCYDPIDTLTMPRHERKTYTVSIEKDGAWAPLAMRMFARQEDCAYPTKRLREVTAQLIAEAPTPHEKAKRIHRFVTQLHQEHRLLPNRKAFSPQSLEDLAGPIHSLDELLDYAKLPDLPRLSANEYLWLAMAMYKCAGFEYRGVLLSDRRLLRFRPYLSTQLLLPNMGVAVKIGEEWKFSLPHLPVPMPFDSLPWYSEALPALWSKVGPQEFIDILPSPSRFSLVGNAARLQLHPDGSLQGTCKRVYSGHAAEAIRGTLNKKTPPKVLFSRLLNADFRKLAAASQATQDDKLEQEEDKDEEKPAIKNQKPPVVITQIKGLNDGDERIEIDYTLHLPAFAISAGQRLIVRPSIFRSESTALFTSSTRVTDIQFPYKLQELDDVVITLPPGLEPEGIEQPASRRNEALFIRNQLSYDATQRTLKLRREFNSEVLLAKPNLYPAIKEFYDELARADRQEVLLKREAALP